MSGGVFSGIGSGLLGLEMPLPQSHQQQSHENPHHLHVHTQHPHMVVNFSPHQQDVDQQSQSVKQHYPYGPKTKHQHSPLSDEDEPGVAPEDGNGDGKRTSPWQRMKWTDNMVRLLIAAVYYIGDEVGSDGSEKKKTGGLLQKKGKWKSVSRAMMQKGFYVSPQQCEDKFNDLNKRYKRVNDIIGKGTACKVVENQNLLDAMDHISPKMKDEVRKLLSSKHLFFREMCAYHNSCNNGAPALHHSPLELSAEPSHHVPQHPQQLCLHSSEKNSADRAVKVGSEEEDEDDDEEEDEDDDEDVLEHCFRGQTEHGNEDDDVDDRQHLTKRSRKELPVGFSLDCELLNLTQDGTRSPLEKQKWLKTRLMQLEGRRVEYLCEAFELEKQRLKWLKYSGKKEREMELCRLKNERRKLENERMILLVKEKEMELSYLHQQQSSNKIGEEPSSAL